MSDVGNAGGDGVSAADGTDHAEFVDGSAVPMDGRFVVHRLVAWAGRDGNGPTPCGTSAVLTPRHLGKSGCLVCGTEGFQPTGKLII
jgi:hypothetical protein